MQMVGVIDCNGSGFVPQETQQSIVNDRSYEVIHSASLVSLETKSLFNLCGKITKIVQSGIGVVGLQDSLKKTVAMVSHTHLFFLWCKHITAWTQPSRVEMASWKESVCSVIKEANSNLRLCLKTVGHFRDYADSILWLGSLVPGVQPVFSTLVLSSKMVAGTRIFAAAKAGTSVVSEIDTILKLKAVVEELKWSSLSVEGRRLKMFLLIYYSLKVVFSWLTLLSMPFQLVSGLAFISASLGVYKIFLKKQVNY